MRAAPWLLCAALCVSANPSSQAGGPAKLTIPGFGNTLQEFNGRTLKPLQTLIGVRTAVARIADTLDPSGPVPADLILIRVSRRVLEQQIEQNIERNDPVDDNILGTDIRGTAHVNGASQLLVVENDRQAEINAVFAGKIHSKTVGHNGPVVLQINSTTPFRASKRIVIDADGIRMLPTEVSAKTTSHTTDIDAQVGGLRGRIAERIAWKRSAQMQPQADAIGSQIAARQIQQAFDEEVVAATDIMEASLLGAIPKLTWEDGSALAVRFRSAPDYVEIIVHRPNATLDERQLEPPPVDGDPAIAVRVHRGVLLKTANAANLKQMLQPLLTGSMVASQRLDKPENSVYLVEWSADGQWLAFDHSVIDELPEPVIADRRVPALQTAVGLPKW